VCNEQTDENMSGCVPNEYRMRVPNEYRMRVPNEKRRLCND